MCLNTFVITFAVLSILLISKCAYKLWKDSKIMAKSLDLTRDGISYNIKVLKEKGIIERVGSTKNGIWKINVTE